MALWDETQSAPGHTLPMLKKAFEAGRASRPAFTSAPVGDALFERAPALRVTEDRVLIQADREDHAPTQTETGLFLASSLAAAVEGEDAADSWFVGTIVQLGPLVNHVDVRARILRWLHELEDEVQPKEPWRDVRHAPRAVIAASELIALRERIEAIPREMPDPLCVGQRVCFSWASGQQIAVDGERYLILRASDVLAVLEE